eukprot:NODE_1334_length_2517_cov_8.391632.p1 GENE.NODE_1334_length_2517_cov_8.391632~~NODE_1334_length_2517_cov_8.391632.p1  ORF type:complete len:730 (+),score=110.57 NODE_1334_length_2517_cov_8.391632:130-2319(+)
MSTLEEPLLQPDTQKMESNQILVVKKTAMICDGPFELAGEELRENMPVWRHQTREQFLYSHNNIWYFTSFRNQTMHSADKHHDKWPNEVHRWIMIDEETQKERLLVGDDIVTLKAALVPIDIFMAANRVCALKDLILSDHPKLVSVLVDVYKKYQMQQYGKEKKKASEAQSNSETPSNPLLDDNPIFSLFTRDQKYEPPRVAQPAHSSSDEDGDCRDCNNVPIKVGDCIHVPAELIPGELVPAEVDHLPERAWYPAKIKKCNDDGTIEFAWKKRGQEGQRREHGKIVKKIKEAKAKDGFSKFLEAHCHGSEWTWYQVFVMGGGYVVLYSGTQIYLSVTSTNTPLSLGGALFIAVSVVVFAIAVIGKGIYSCIRRTASAKKMRQKFTIVVLDPLFRGPLHGMHGIMMEIMVGYLFTLLGTFGVIAGITSNVGVFAISINAAHAFLTSMNVFLSEPAGSRSLRQAELISLLDGMRKDLDINLTGSEFALQMRQFFDEPPTNVVLEISCELFILLAAAAHRVAQDSVRMRHLIITGGYVEMSLSDLEEPEVVETRRDLLIDLFERKCSVAGFDEKDERWFLEGRKVPWHLAIKKSRVAEYERKLMEQGMRQGAGCFSWASTDSGWAQEEAYNPAAMDHLLLKIEEKNDNYTSALIDMLNSETDKKIQCTRRLLVKGADPFNDLHGDGWTAHKIAENGKRPEPEILKLFERAKIINLSKDACTTPARHPTDQG